MELKLIIKNNKKLGISTVIHKPDNAGKFPAVLLIHGFTGYKDEEHIVDLGRDLAKNGFVGIRFDASGFGESEGTIEKDYRLSNFYTNISHVFDYLKKLDYVDAERLGIWGNSLGGTLAIIFAANNPWIKAVCTVSVPTMFARKDNFERRTKAWEETGYFEKVSSRYGKIKIPYDFVVDSQKWNCLDYVDKVKQPILFVIGDKDTNVYPQNTKEIYDLAHKPKQMLEISGMDHLYKKVPEKISEVNRHVINFYKYNL